MNFMNERLKISCLKHIAQNHTCAHSGV